MMAVEQLFHLRSDSTAQPSTFHSLLIPQHATIAHTPLLGQISTSPGPRLTPRPTNLTLKTFSTQSLTIQTTIFNANTMNAANLDVCPSPPPPIHLSSTVMRSSANSTEKTLSLSLSPLTPGPGHGPAQCYRHSAFLTTTHHLSAKNPGAPHTLTTNITDPMPTSCTNASPNHHAHSGSSYPPTSDGCNAICITNTTDVLWQLLNCTHTKSTCSPTHRTQHI